jgi:hypothetical protein
VTFSEEREAAGVDEVFATLDEQLVGLIPGLPTQKTTARNASISCSR